jgi:hypothetical protein
MSGTTIEDMLVAARAKLVTIAPARDAAALFLEHTTNQPFEHAPVSKRDGFEVVAREIMDTGAFGVTGQEELEFRMVVRLGHCPAGPDKTREQYRAKDVQRIKNVFEYGTVWPTGTQAVLYEKETVVKDNPNWWLSEIFFKTVLVRDVVSS